MLRLYAASALLVGSLMLVPCVVAQTKSEENVGSLRWAEGTPGCTFSADSDGKYRYGLWTDDFGIILAVDVDEVRKTAERVEPILAVHLTIRNRSDRAFGLDPRNITLKFVDHYQQVQSATDPDDLAANVQKDADTFRRDQQRELFKHPERRDEIEKLSSAHLESIAATQAFLRSSALKANQVNAGQSDTGWLFFNAKSKWIQNWKKQEQFVLRVPVAGRAVEFPFALPPSQGDLILRKR